MFGLNEVLTHAPSALFATLVLIVIEIVVLALKGLLHLPSGRTAGELRSLIRCFDSTRTTWPPR